jgi:hypothetical protein
MFFRGDLLYCLREEGELFGVRSEWICREGNCWFYLFL